MQLQAPERHPWAERAQQQLDELLRIVACQDLESLTLEDPCAILLGVEVERGELKEFFAGVAIETFDGDVAVPASAQPCVGDRRTSVPSQHRDRIAGGFDLLLDLQLESIRSREPWERSRIEHEGLESE